MGLYTKDNDPLTQLSAHQYHRFHSILKMPRKNLRQAPALSAELEEYAQLYFKYSIIIRKQVDAVRHLPDEVDKAYAKVCREHDEYQRNTPHPTSLEELYQALKYFGDLCENAAPQTVLELS